MKTLEITAFERHYAIIIGAALHKVAYVNI
jgi:hypothetical protein